MNTNQTNNISVLTPNIVDVLKKRKWRDASTALLVCTGCGKKNITGPIVAFYDFRGENILCYGCQKLSQIAEAPVTVPLAVNKPVEKQIQNTAIEKKFEANKNVRDWENRNEAITEKQLGLLRQLINEKVDEGERQIQLDSVGEMTKAEGSAAIARLINNAF